MRRTLSSAAVGVLLALGAPLGWLLLRGAAARPDRIGALLAADPGLYAYMLLGTALAFGIFGAALGRMSDALDALARTDALTRLPNVRAFGEQLERELSRVARGAGPLSMVMVDLDHFKQVNDRLGHGAGDEVLAHAARVLAQSVRAVDSVARVGGEEFAILCPGADASAAVAIAERARAALERAAVRTRAGEVPVTASFGVAQLDGDPHALRGRADAALYRAKGEGRNRVRTADAAPQAAAGA
jgi:diguanylate cyclase (GGDEF)-like protein